MDTNAMENIDSQNRVTFRKGKVDEEEIIYITQLMDLWLKNKNPRVICTYSLWYLCPIQCLKMMM